MSDSDADSVAHDAVEDVFCAGCDDFMCLVRAKTLQDLPATELAAFQFLQSHGLFRQPVRCHENSAKTHRDLERAIRCCSMSDGHLCNKKVPATLPFFPPRGKVSFSKKMRAWWMLARGNSISSVRDAVGLGEDAATQIVNEICDIVYDHRSTPIVMTRFAVDETFVGKRKYHKGKRVRKESFWFVTATEIRNRVSKGNRFTTEGKTYWHSLWGGKRDAKTLTAFVRRVAADNRRASIYTDAFKSYTGLKKHFKRHAIVVHKREFVNKQGEHTNHAENAHSCVKRRFRRQFSSAKDALVTAKRYIFCTFFFKVCMQARATKLFQLLKAFANEQPYHEM